MGLTAVPARAGAYIAALTTATLAAVLVLLTRQDLTSLADVPAFVVLALVAAWFPLRIHRRDEVHAITLEDAVLVAFLVSPQRWLAPVVLVAVTVVARILMRHTAAKVLFAAGQVGIAALVAVSATSLLAVPGDRLSMRGLAIGFAGGAIYNLTTFVLLAMLFRLMAGVALREMASDAWRLGLVTWFGNSSLGLLLALVAQADARGVLLLGVLGIGVHLGYRGYSRAVFGRQRAEALGALSGLLVSFGAGHLDEDDWLPTLRHLFAARTAAVIRFDGICVDGSSEHLPLEATSAVEAPQELHARDGSRLLAVPVVHDGSSLGTLVVAGQQGVGSWGAADLSVLSAVAGEVAVALWNRRLFRQVEQERARWAEESRKLNDILCAASDGIAMISSDGTIVSWNPGMTVLTGVEEQQAGGRPWWTVLRLRDLDDEDLLPEGSHVVCSALAGERHPDPIALQVLRRDGTWRWLRATFSPLLEDDGAVAGSVIVARDVTAEREAEGLKADFVATVSHELRTPLTPIKGFLTTLQQRGPELTRDQIETMYSSMGTQVTRLERLVSDLLVVADLDRGRLVLASELVRLRPVVDIAVDDEAGRDRERITVSGEPDVTAAADAAAVVRILRALVSNALKHTEGPVEVELAREDRVPVVRVRDHGPGIPAWEQDRIFRRFHRLGDHLLRTQGPGLGLSIARALADRLGGAIDIDSELGHGATFTLRLRPAGPVPVGRRSSLADAG
jgi:PAS domain S-box-containing protein